MSLGGLAQSSAPSRRPASQAVAPTGCYLYSKAECHSANENPCCICPLHRKVAVKWSPTVLTHISLFLLHGRPELSLCRASAKQRPTSGGARQVMRVNVPCTSAACFAGRMEAQTQQHRRQLALVGRCLSTVTVKSSPSHRLTML